jgi:peptidoglycan endopeptidase LytF
MTHTVQAGETLFAIARKYNLTPNELREFNDMAPTAQISVGQVLKVSKTQTSVPKTDKPKVEPTASNAEFYTVTRGDTWERVAERFKLTVVALRELNNASRTTPLSEGQKIRVVAPVGDPPPQGAPTTHIVKTGESIFGIAARYNLTVALLREYNNMSPTDRISIGQTLNLRPESSPVSKPTEPVRPAEPSRPVAPTASSSSGFYSFAKVPANLRAKAEQFAKERSIFKVVEVSGRELLQGGLSGSVGKGGDNNAQDVALVQQRLVKLGHLTASHGEDTSRDSGKVADSKIPKTLAAINTFQERRKVNGWATHAAAATIFGGRFSGFTPGLIGVRDISFVVLRDLADWNVTFPHPQTGAAETVSLKNFVFSSFTRFYDGIAYAGKIKTDTYPNLFSNLKIDDGLKEAFRKISAHEGGFDAINGWDRATFSFGFVQFAGTIPERNDKGELGAAFSRIKIEQPKFFAEYFQKFGVDVNPELRGDRINSGELVVFDIQATNGSCEVKGFEAEKAIRADVILNALFVRAGYVPELIGCQIMHGIENFAKPAFARRPTITLGSATVNNLPMSAYIQSPMGRGALLDMSINQGVGGANALFARAINEVVKVQSINSAEELSRLDERKVLETILEQQNASGKPDPRIVSRTGGFLNSSLASTKNPKFADGSVA